MKAAPVRSTGQEATEELQLQFHAVWGITSNKSIALPGVIPILWNAKYAKQPGIEIFKESVNWTLTTSVSPIP